MQAEEVFWDVGIRKCSENVLTWGRDGDRALQANTFWGTHLSLWCYCFSWLGGQW